MRKSYLFVALVLALLLAAPVFAGEGKCDHEAQVCLNYMAKHLEGRGWAGVDLDEKNGALTIKTVFENTPADKAGVKVGDQLVAVNGLRLGEENEEAMQAMMAEMKPGNTFRYTLNRNGKEREIKVTLEPMPDDAVQRIVGAHMLQGHATTEVASN